MSTYFIRARFSVSSFVLLAVFVFSLLFVAPASVQGQSSSVPNQAPGSVPSQGIGSQPNTGFGSVPNRGTCSGQSGSGVIRNPLNGICTFAVFLQEVLNVAIMVGIPIAVLFLIISGFRFITARGDTTKLGEARENFKYVIIGVAIFVGASALAQLIVGTLKQVGLGT